MSYLHQILRHSFVLAILGWVAVGSPMSVEALTVTENFDSLASVTANGWTGSGNTINGNNFGFSNTNNVLGAGFAGEGGGTFARSLPMVYFADTNLGGSLSRSDSLMASGSFRLSNSDFNGGLFVGFFNTSNLSLPVRYIGLTIGEPSGAASNPFRGLGAIHSSDGTVTNTGIINLAQNVTHTFNLTWTPGVGGSGTLSGLIAGTPISITQAGTHPDDLFNAFGFGSGLLSVAPNTAANTNPSFFDSLTYSVVPPAPEPGTAVLLLMGIVGLRTMKKRQAARQLA